MSLEHAPAAAQPTVEVVAHRGSGTGTVEPQSAPENTLPAFEAAWAEGADACELDAHLTRDGEIVVIHDETTGRTCDTDLVVAEHTLAELRRLDAGGFKGARWAGTRLPSLEEVLATIPQGRRLFVEIKTGPVIVPRLREVVSAAGRDPAQVVFISFELETIGKVKALMPRHACLLLVSFEWDATVGQWNLAYDESRPDRQTFRTVWRKPADLDWLVGVTRAAGLDGLDVSQAQPDGFFLKMRAAGLPWAVWTVDDPNAALAMAVKGAASITTNKPAYLRRLLEQHGFATGPAGRAAPAPRLAR